MIDALHSESRLGTILVRTLTVHQDRVEDALWSQRLGDERDLGTILSEAGLIETQDLEQALQLQRRMRGDDVARAFADTVRLAYARARVFCDDVDW